MIEGNEGERQTPKEFAQFVLADGAMTAASYWTGSYAMQYEKMTPREREQVQEQLIKLKDRVARLLGYEKGWST